MDTRTTLEERRDEIRARVAELAKRPELGAAQGFGKRIGDGTTEAISRITDIGVGRSLETTLARTERALEKLVETGKSKGFLTYDGVNDALPADVAPDQLDDVVGALGDEDIEIVDGATQVKIASGEGAQDRPYRWRFLREVA